MASENEILNELKDMKSPLAACSRLMPFAVQQAYFDNLHQAMLDGVRASELPDADLTLPKALPFSVPAAYFNDSAAQIISLANISDASEDVLEVPEGYFDALPARILKAVKAENLPVKKGRIIAFQPARRALQWVAAAVLVFGIGLGSYRIYYTPDRKAQLQLAHVDRDAINDYVSQSIDETPASNTVAMNVPAAAAVKDLSKEEIAAYLDENGLDDAGSAN